MRKKEGGMKLHRERKKNETEKVKKSWKEKDIFTTYSREKERITET